jgi:hypothetical protein
MEHDVYSIGIVLLELALGRSPITQNGEEKAFNNDVVEEELQPSQVTIVDKVMKDEEGASKGLRDMLIGLAGARGAVRNRR